MTKKDDFLKKRRETTQLHNMETTTAKALEKRDDIPESKKKQLRKELQHRKRSTAYKDEQ